jgi:geranylgeranyl diphosphate synthase type I
MHSPFAKASPLDAADLRVRVQEIVDQVLQQESGVLSRAGQDLVPLADACAGLMGGGERLRPAFCYWGWRGSLANPIRTSMTPQCVLRPRWSSSRPARSYPRRRDGRLGRPPGTARRPPPLRHLASAAPAGSAPPENFGVGAAILLGDLCLSWADQVLMASGMPTTVLMPAKAIYDEMRTELMAGQYLDLLEQARGGGSIERALQVVRYKSAKYTIERPLHLGAALGGASQDLMSAYSAYGLPWAKPSSCGTTSSASSATRARPASPPGTTCERASARC